MPRLDSPFTPKIINFVWIGSNIPPKYLFEIQKLAAAGKRDGFEVNLWVDNKDKYMKNHLMGNRFNSNLNLIDINELRIQMATDPFYQENNRLARFISCVEREAIGFYNYAAVSDLIRYEILRQKGGYYFDTDIEFFLEDKRLIPDTLPKGIKIVGYRTNWGNIAQSPSMIASTPNHPALEKNIVNILNQYQELDTSVTADPKHKTQRSKMDQKRWPIGNQKLNLTIQASGNLDAITTHLGNDITNESYFMQASDKKTAVMGIRVKDNYDKSWLDSTFQIKISTRPIEDLQSERNTIFIGFDDNYEVVFYKIDKNGTRRSFYPKQAPDKFNVDMLRELISAEIKNSGVKIPANMQKEIFAFTNSQPREKMFSFDEQSVKKSIFKKLDQTVLVEYFLRHFNENNNRYSSFHSKSVKLTKENTTLEDIFSKISDKKIKTTLQKLDWIDNTGAPSETLKKLVPDFVEKWSALNNSSHKPPRSI